MQDSNQPLLSICIASLNRAELLNQTLEHLANTLDPSYEIVVSNNCSSDHTIDVLEAFRKKWKEFRYISQARQLTATENFSAALCMARGEYVYSFSDDDRIIMEGLSNGVELMQRRADVIGVFGSYHEWDPKEDRILATIRFVNETMVFPKGSKMEIFHKFFLLWLPVMRTEQCRRFCIHAYDKSASVFWPLVNKMLDHGAVAVIPDLFYKHAHTQPRAEYNLTEGWFHDENRAQYEIFVGLQGCGTVDNAKLITDRVAQAYLHGVRFAVIKKEWLTGRHFLLRARAYGLVSNEQLLEYEKFHIVGMVAERLNALVSIAPGIRRVIIESHPISERMRSALAEIMPEMDISIISREELLDIPTNPEEYIIVWDYQTLLERGAKFEQDPLHQCSLGDVFANCRLLSGELVFK